MSKVQSILFEKSKWTPADAREWLSIHKIKPLKKVHVTDRYYRYRVREPTGKNYSIVHIGIGIHMIIQYWLGGPWEVGIRAPNSSRNEIYWAKKRILGALHIESPLFIGNGPLRTLVVGPIPIFGICNNRIKARCQLRGRIVNDPRYIGGFYRF